MAADGPPPADPADPALEAYLETLDLERLDLADVALEPADAATPVPLLPVLLALATACCGAWLAWYPTTVAYQQSPLGGWAIAAVALLAVALAAGLWITGAAALRGQPARRATAMLLRAAAGAQRRAFVARAARARVGALERVALAAAAVGAAVLLASNLAAEATRPRTSGPGWLLGIGVAVAMGLGLGRWVAQQAGAAPVVRQRRAAPAWAKWASLGALGLGAATALLGEAAGGGGAAGPGLTLLGLAVGLGMALWLARRFDDMEGRAAAAAAAATEAAEAAQEAALLAAMAATAAGEPPTDAAPR